MINSKLKTIAGYLYSLQYDYAVNEYFAVIAIPPHWTVVYPTYVLGEIVSSNAVSIIIHLRSKNKDVNELINYVLELVKYNHKADAYIKKLNEKFELKKEKIKADEYELGNIIKATKELMIQDFSERLNKGKNIVAPDADNVVLQHQHEHKEE